VSLILEALKKVERERVAPEQRGFLVLGPAAWAPSRSNVGWVLGMVAAAGVAGGAVYVGTRPAATAVQVAPTPAETVAPASAEPVVPGPAAPAVSVRAVPPANADWGPPPQSETPRTRSAAPAGTGKTVPLPPSGPVLQLNAISEQDGVPIAVVNERVVREGDTFDGIRVLRIGTAEVEVEVAGARRILRF
jgi:hypothetical protein